MNLWIVPASDEASFQNIPRSLSRPVPAGALESHGITTPTFAWGARSGSHNDGKFKQMSRGDICVFYTQGGENRDKRFWWAGRVSSYRQSREVSSAIWSTPDFEHVYFMDEVWPTNISLDDFSRDTGYDPAAPKGIHRASGAALDRINAKSGNVEQWARGHSLGVVSMIEGSAPQVINASILERLLPYIRSSGFQFSDQTLRSFYAALRAKPFVILAGNSGTGKSRLARLFAAACGATEQNGGFKLIAVQPDWSDGADLLGFSDLNGKFRAGKMVEPLLRAHADSARPVFVCLDEMNLARVEHYFSDYLALIESRRRESGRVITDAVISAKHLTQLDEADVSADLRGALAAAKNTGGGLCLPPNFILVGTVNMDETTQPFSRKVLDRACTLEFNDVDLKHGFARSAGVASTPASAVSATELVAEFLTLTDLLPANQPAAEKVADFLTTLNQHLILAGLEVGYRIRDEGAAYFVYARQAGMTEEQALHSIALQKVLPRVQGSSPRLEKVLAGLTQHFAGGTAPDAQADDLNEKLAALRRDGSAKPVVRKLAGMWLTLREEGFTSFWLT